MVVLDAVHQIEREQANDLAVRWRLQGREMRLVLGGGQRQSAPDVHDQAQQARSLAAGQPRADARFRRSGDLISDVSWNYLAKKSVKPFKPRPPDGPDGTWRMAQWTWSRCRNSGSASKCFLCQDVCHVLREHRLFDQFVGPRHLVYGGLEMHRSTPSGGPAI